MLTPDTESSTLNETTTSSTGPLGPILNRWTQITLDDRLVENEARAQIQVQVQNLIRDTRLPWKTVESIPSWVESVVMDVLQQELDDERHPGVYRTACMKCLRVLCKSRNIVPFSLYLRDVTREGENPVAGGGFADIWKGRLHDTQVCLKVLRVFCPEEQKTRVLRDFCQEALVWRQLRHPNILPFLGVNEDLFAPRYCLISPWMVNGNIMSYLEAHPDHDRLTSLVQVAEGMKYLHNLDPPVVHADIRGANILVMNDLCCCLADFGLSLLAESQTLNSSSRMSKGSIRWLAPEYIDPKAVIDRAYIAARDIYAYGCTVVEIFTGKPPFSGIKNEAAVIHMVMTGNFPPRPQYLLQDGLWSLVVACLTASPSQRPIAEQIPKVLAGEIKPCQESMKEGNITIASRYYDNGATLQCASDLSLSQIPDSGYTSKSPLAGIANGGTAPSDPDHSNPITPDNQKKSEFLDMDEDPPDEDKEEDDTDERDAYDAVEPGNLGPTPVQSTSPTSPHGRKLRAAAEDFPPPPSYADSQKQAQAVARARAAAIVLSPQRPSGYDYPDPDQAQLQPPRQDQHEMPSVPAFCALPLLSTDLPRTTINVSHSFVEPNDRGKEVLAFVVEVNPGSGKDGWKMKKMYSDVLNLDQRVRNSVGKGVGEKIANSLKGKLWKDCAPANFDQRKAVLQNYLQTLIKLPEKINDEVIAFFTSDIMCEMNQLVMQAGHKEGYLTKRGENFGVWKTRYFVLLGPVLEYYDYRGGAYLGSITVTGAQIGRQQRTEQPTTMDEEKEYRHAFLIIEADFEPWGLHPRGPRHVLCAESDADRDSWVEMLVRYYSGTYSEEAGPYSWSSSSSGPNGTSSVTLSKGTSTSTSSLVPVWRPVRGLSKDDISVSKQAAVPISRLAPDEYNSTITRSSSPSKSVQETSPTERYPGPAVSDALNARRILDREQGLASSLPDSFPLASASGASGTNCSLGHYSDTPRITRSPERPREREYKSLPLLPTPDRDRAPLPEGKVKISGPLNRTPIPAGYKFESGRDTQDKSGSDRREKAKSRGFWGFGRLNGAKKPPLPRPVFGVTLEESLEVSSVAHLPSIVFRTIQYLEAKNAEQEEGIYSLSGSSAVIKNLKDMFNAEGDIDLLASDEYWDPHAIAGLLKSFLRELPAHILTQELYLDFLAVMEGKDLQERVRMLSHLIASLPIANYSLLRVLTAHLILIVQNSAVNKMSMQNVGIIFKPTLGIPAGVFSLMLDEFNQVFNVEGVEEELEELAEHPRWNSRQYTDGAADQLLGLTGQTLSVPVESDGEFSSLVADDTDQESAASGPHKPTHISLTIDCS